MWLFFVVVVCSSEAHSRIQICQLFVPYTDHALFECAFPPDGVSADNNASFCLVLVSISHQILLT